MKEFDIPKWPIALLRVYMGYFFLSAGLGKLFGGFLSKPILLGIVNGYVKEGRIPFFQSFLTDVVIPNVAIFNYLVVFGEALLGISLILGLFLRLSTLLGIFMNLNFYFACPKQAQNLNKTFIIIETVLFLLAAGRVYGLDALLKKRYPKSLIS